MKYADIIRLREIDTAEVLTVLMDAIRRGVRWERGGLEPLTLGLAYVLWLYAQAPPSKPDADIDAFLVASIDDPTVLAFLREVARAIEHDIVFSLLGRFSTDQLLAYVLFGDTQGRSLSLIGSRHEAATPSAIASLASRLLDIAPEDSVADYGAGTGSFSVIAYMEEPRARYHSIEISTMLAGAAHLRSVILGSGVTSEQADILRARSEGRRYDKIFAHLPMGMNRRKFEADQAKWSRTTSQHNPLHIRSDEWLYVPSVLDTLSEGGRAVMLMRSGAFWNETYVEVRRWLIGQGLVNAVVSLPERALSDTGMASVLLVLGHGNTSVRMVDGTRFFEDRRRQMVLTPAGVDAIADGYRNESDFSRDVSADEIAGSGFVLHPNRYLGEIEIDNGVPLSELMFSVTRGAMIPASQLDTLQSAAPTPVQYLQVKHIVDGAVDLDLPYLAEVEPKLQRHKLQTGDLLISKIGDPLKVAVAEVPKGRTIIPTGNLYVLRLNEDKVDPYYIKAYLESERGLAALRRLSTGSVIASLSLSGLKDVLIPMVSLEAQRKIVLKYRTKADEIALLRQRIVRLQRELKSVIDEQG